VRPTDSHVENDSWAAGGLGFQDEKLGHAGQRTVGNVLTKKGHERASSYGHVVEDRY
jgi:hypothetical protein